MLKWFQKKFIEVEEEVIVPAIREKILIVEDNELNLKLFTGLLGDAHGYEIRHTGEGHKVMNLVRDFLPDLILLDINLPDTSGIDVIGWIKEDAALLKIPIIAVTAFSMKADRISISKAGVSAIISKPIEIKPFIGTIANVLSGDAVDVESHRIEVLATTNADASDQANVVGIKPRNSKPHLGWGFLHGKRGWNLQFATILEAQVHVENSLVPEEQRLILEYNSKLDGLKKEVARNSEYWTDNNIEALLAGIIKITRRLAEELTENSEVQEILAFYITIAGLSAKKAEESTNYFKQAVEVMERILRDFPEHLSNLENKHFRYDVAQAYALLAQSDPRKVKTYREKWKRLNARRPKKERKSKSIDPFNMHSRYWTESRILAAEKLWVEGMLFEKIASELGGNNRNHIVQMVGAQRKFRKSPAMFESSSSKYRDLS